MKEQFEEISSMLDKVVGGQNLFGIDTETMSFENCTTSCTKKCQNGVGTVDGTTKGIVTPTIPEE